MPVVGSGELVQGCKGPAAGGRAQFEDSSREKIRGTSRRCCPEEIALSVKGQGRGRARPVGKVCEVVENGVVPGALRGGHQFKDGATAGGTNVARASGIRRSEKVAAR